MAAPSDDASVLLLCVETHPRLWQAAAAGGADTAQALGFVAFMQHLLVFVNAFLLLNGANQLVVCAMHSDGCHILYQSPQLQTDGAAHADMAGAAAPTTLLAARVGELRGADDSGAAVLPTPLSAALSRVLCYANKAMRGPAGTATHRCRILCLHGSPDTPSQYVGTMNAIFCAQNLGVPIDVCLLGAQESPFLQQAASLTGGLYMRPPRPQALVQYLMTVFAADVLSRTAMQLPHPKGVDFRASCFCHKRVLHIGYVCSVCLSIYCTACKECNTCGADFGVPA